MKKWMNGLTNVAILVLAIAAVVQTYWIWSSRRAPAPTNGYAIGERLDPRKLNLEGPTLLVVTKSTCSFCSESMPFYGSLRYPRITWIAAREDAGLNREYLEAHGIKPTSLLTITEAGLDKVRATPMLIFVDEKGVVRQSWKGMLTTQEEAEVRKTLNGG